MHVGLTAAIVAGICIGASICMMLVFIVVRMMRLERVLHAAAQMIRDAKHTALAAAERLSPTRNDPPPTQVSDPWVVPPETYPSDQQQQQEQQEQQQSYHDYYSDQDIESHADNHHHHQQHNQSYQTRAQSQSAPPAPSPQHEPNQNQKQKQKQIKNNKSLVRTTRRGPTIPGSVVIVPRTAHRPTVLPANRPVLSPQHQKQQQQGQPRRSGQTQTRTQTQMKPPDRTRSAPRRRHTPPAGGGGNRHGGAASAPP